ncbi:MAG: Rieske 2Fe-2S domain-containing protein [Actinomycetota bacterium]|nr:Rieske 2Fe-2S domain-containing protein [Actinomycetota bacterium]
MDKEALDRSIARRLVDHIEHRSTDMAPAVLELPAEIYTSQARFAREAEVLFRNHPLVLCLSGALPGPGSYLTVEVMDTPLLLTRDGAGRVHALANICRHRGVRVADGSGAARRFTCPFHAWVYDLEGRLVGVPESDAFEGMCREDKGLVELPVAEGYGLIVGRIRPGPAVDVEAYLGPELTEELALLDFAAWPLAGEAHVHPVGANWKVTLDTYRENYHFNYLHRRTLAEYAYGGVLTFDAFGPHVRNASAIRTIDELRGRPEEEWEDPDHHFSYQYSLFPNVCLTFDFRHIEFWAILPVDAHSSKVLHMAHLKPGLAPEEASRYAEMAPWICESVVDGEDFWVAARTEPHLRSGLLDRVVFGRNEPAPQHLHRNFASALAAAAPSGSAPSDSAAGPAVG